MSRNRSRQVVMPLVFAFHFALIFVLLETSKTRRMLTASPAPLELLLLPPMVAQKVQADTARSSTARKLKPSPPSATEFTLTPNIPAPQSQQPTGAIIDWASEAETVAAAIASQAKATDRDKTEVGSRPPKSVFPEPPAHHAGDEFTTSSGERAVFVSDNCYQVASTQSPTAMNNGMGNQTYCIGKSDVPRGDLFDQLPAYKKYHPN